MRRGVLGMGFGLAAGRRLVRGLHRRAVYHRLPGGRTWDVGCREREEENPVLRDEIKLLKGRLEQIEKRLLELGNKIDGTEKVPD